MFSYSLNDGTPSDSLPIWDRDPLQAVASGVLTPFSYSVLAEIMRRAWYGYYDQLGFIPPPGSRLVRYYEGHAYLNLSISAKLDAENAGISPPLIYINGQPRRLTEWEKTGFFSRFRNSQNRKKIDLLLENFSTNIVPITQRAREWYIKTKELKWTQAEILQVMEEIERFGVDSLMAFFAARHNLDLIQNQLLQLTQEQAPFPRNMFLLYNVLYKLDDLIEQDMVETLLTIAENMSNDEQTVVWLNAQKYTQWTQTLPNQQIIVQIQEFLDRYGHRSSREGEIGVPRWVEQSELIFGYLLAYSRHQPKVPPHPSSEFLVQTLFNNIGPKHHKTIQTSLNKMQTLMRLQSQALNAFAYILAGTRNWAVAAGKEAMEDARLRTLNDVFFYQLEEVKEMMTGEWNVSNTQEIQAICDDRKEQYEKWQDSSPEVLLIGDKSVQRQQPQLPGAVGQSTGRFHHFSSPEQVTSPYIIGTHHADSGWVMTLPLAQGFILEYGSPLDPVIALMRRWQIPTLLYLDRHQYNTLNDLEETTIDGEGAIIRQKGTLTPL